MGIRPPARKVAVTLIFQQEKWLQGWPRFTFSEMEFHPHKGPDMPHARVFIDLVGSARTGAVIARGLRHFAGCVVFQRELL